MSTENTPKKLKQELGLFGAIIMGLGSMIGSGIFVSLGIAAGISGSAVLLAVILAGLLAICNAFNIAQLAASNAVSGGVYEFGYRYLNPWLGFTGGWMYVLAKTAAPLEVVASSLNIPGASKLLTAGALAAMLGVLISATLGLSRMLLAMARRQDMPSFMTKLNSAGTTPYWAVIVVGSAIAMLVLIGNVKVTWTFSVFASLHRSLITNLAALKMGDEERMYPMWVTWASIISCVFLSVWVEPQIWLVGSIFIVAGLIWHFVAQSSKSADYKIPFLSRLTNQVAK